MNGRKRGSGEGSYYRRKDGTWNFRVMIDGVRYSADGRTKTLAKLSALEKAEVGAKPDAIVTFGELVEEWSGLSATRVKLAPSTQDQYRSLLRTHALPTLEKARLDQLTKRVLARAVDGIEGSSSTRRSTYAALVKVLDYGVDTGRLGRNMAREVRRPHAAPAARRELSNAEAGDLIKAASGHRWEVAVWLSLGCGLRRGEVLALRWSDFNRDLTELAVTGNVTRTSAGLVRGAPKTRRGQRMVPVPTAVTTALRAHRAAQAESRLLVGPAWLDLGYVLTNEVGGIVEPRALSRVWAGWAKAAGLSDQGTHLGRHYAATTLLASGAASVADVAAQLGHDPAVLLNTYASAIATSQRAASDVLGASLTEAMAALRE